MTAWIAPAQAHRRDFPFTYDWHQPAKGEKEIESHTDFRRSDGFVQQAMEFEYGITDRFMLAPYIQYEKDRGEGLHYDSWKVESRYQLGKFRRGKILPGLYAEYEKPKDEKAELEFKVILSRYDKRGGDLSLNLITEHSLESGAAWEKEYSFGYARPLGHSRYEPRVGFEWIHHITDRRINAGPTLAFAPTQNTWLVGGLAFPLTSRGNRVEYRLLAEYEWF
jgi:hypothetical protein